jgi:hypothetical protein
MSLHKKKELTDDFVDEIVENCKKAGSWPLFWPEELEERPFEISFEAHCLAGLRRDYDAGDPLALIEAVRDSYRFRFSLPLWCHHRMATIFGEYLSGGGDKDLRCLLNIKRGPGRDNDPFKRRGVLGLNNEIVFNLCTLNKYLRFSLPVSFLILSKMKIRFSDGISTRSAVLSVSRIEEIYKDSQSKNSLSIEYFEDIYGETLEDRLDCFMSNYAETFRNLYEDGIFDEYGHWPSAQRSFNALFPDIEPIALPASDESGG